MVRITVRVDIACRYPLTRSPSGASIGLGHPPIATAAPSEDSGDGEEGDTPLPANSASGGNGCKAEIGRCLKQLVVKKGNNDHLGWFSNSLTAQSMCAQHCVRWGGWREPYMQTVDVGRYRALCYRRMVAGNDIVEVLADVDAARVSTADSVEARHINQIRSEGLTVTSCNVVSQRW
jgi:hypothetical protein